MGGTYHVHTEHFSGPFDLLLHLVARRRLEIADVSLALIVDDYLDAVTRMSELDLEVASEFLVVAATLMELKAARLLPGPDPDVDELDLSARDLLYARLLDYRTFRGAADWLSQRWADHVGLVGREVGVESVGPLHVPVEIPLTPDELARLAEQVLSAAQDTDAHIPLPQRPSRLTVAAAGSLLLARLAAADGPLDFDELADELDEPGDIVVAFLAVLELYKREHVDLHQDAAFGPLALVPQPPAGEKAPAARTAVGHSQ